MGYRDLIDAHVSLELDTSALDERLGKIDERLNDLGGEDILDEDKVNDLIATYVSNEGYVTEYDMDRKMDDLVASDDLDSRVEDVISNGEYTNASDVDSQIDDKLSGIEERLDTLEGRADDEKSIESLAERMAQQDARIDTLLAHIKGLETQMETLARDASAAVNVLSLLRQIVQSLFGSR